MIASLIRGYVQDAVEASLKHAMAPVAPYLRKLAGGMVLMLLSIIAFGVVLMALATGLFLALASLPYVAAAFWTALIFFVLGLVFVGAGAGIIKKPR